MPQPEREPKRTPAVELIPEDSVLILFGVTGDLAKRKLLPGLFHLFAAGLMPRNFHIIGTAPPNSGTDGATFTEYVHDVLTRFGRRDLTEADWGRFSARLSFAPATANDLGELRGAVTAAERDISARRRIFYLAVPPAAFEPTVLALGRERLADDTSRLIIEKPFGHDLASARHLNRVLHRVFAEERIYRIDHFLGKEAVQNILALRFANGLFESAWNRDHVAYVQIDVPEQIAIEGRAGFYEATGAFRDMVVTHLFQLLGFVAMEPPRRFDADALDDAKRKVFEAMVPLDPEHVVFGQYQGYREEPGVAADSTVETLAALEVRIDNHRWKGVPFYLRTGKAMAERRISVILGFKVPPMHLFDLPDDQMANSQLVLEVSDPGAITIPFLAKTPGPAMTLDTGVLHFSYSDSFQITHELEAYERLLHDVMLGDRTLFNQADAIERLWDVSAPLLEHPPAVKPYPRGSWGPLAVERLIAPYRWHWEAGR